MARKTKYEEWFPTKAYECALAGATDEEVATILGVGLTTFYEYQKRYPEFREALKNGKLVPDMEVAAALHKSATGHSVTETKIIGHGDNKREVEVTKYFPPNPTSAIFWLKNRRRNEWRDKNAPADNPADDPGDISDTDRWVAETIKAGSETH